MKLILAAALIGLVAAFPSKIDSKLAQSLGNKQVANVMVNFVGGNEKVIGHIENRTFKTRAERLSSLKHALEQNAAISQEHVQSFLKERSVQFKSLWISNQIYIVGADRKLVEAIAAFNDVSEIHEERIIDLYTPVESKAVKEPVTPLNEWGIEIIEAPAAWKISNGTGVTVAHIDSGVHYTHEALRDNFRADHGWFDPYSISDTPNDMNGHGTHTMGTIAGSKGIGVAPGAQWIACKGCYDTSCNEIALVVCGEWVICPTKSDNTNPDCSKAPDLVSNSWGAGKGDTFFEKITEAWIAGGIIPLFAIGNSGPNCGSVHSPGDLRRVIGVGSTDSSDAVSHFSSVGPADDGRIKPEIVAPGENIRSSIPDSDTSYGVISGTSMACPHAAGVTAILLSINRNLTFAQVRQILIEGVDTDVSSSGASCAGYADTAFPNHHFGYGRINARKIAEAAKAMH